MKSFIRYHCPKNRNSAAISDLECRYCSVFCLQALEEIVNRQLGNHLSAFHTLPSFNRVLHLTLYYRWYNAGKWRQWYSYNVLVLSDFSKVFDKLDYNSLLFVIPFYSVEQTVGCRQQLKKKLVFQVWKMCPFI